jgi:hypothetical protein
MEQLIISLGLHDFPLVGGLFNQIFTLLFHWCFFSLILLSVSIHCSFLLTSFDVVPITMNETVDHRSIIQ